MKTNLIVLFCLTILKCLAVPQGVYTEYKCTLLNGDAGRDYTFDTKAFQPSLRYEFGTILRITEFGKESDNLYSINGDMLTVKYVSKMGARVDTITHRFTLEENAEELILKEYKEGCDESYFLKKHYFKRGSAALPITFKNNITFYTIVEQASEYPGGFEAMKEFIQRTLEVPKNAELKKQGEKVFIKLLISPTGKVVDGEILNVPRIFW